MENLDIRVKLVSTNGKCGLALSGNTSSGGRFGREIQFPSEGATLGQLEQFIMECKYEALYPPKFPFETDWGPATSDKEISGTDKVVQQVLKEESAKVYVPPSLRKPR